MIIWQLGTDSHQPFSILVYLRKLRFSDSNSDVAFFYARNQLYVIHDAHL